MYWLFSLDLCALIECNLVFHSLSPCPGPTPLVFEEILWMGLYNISGRGFCFGHSKLFLSINLGGFPSFSYNQRLS